MRTAADEDTQGSQSVSHYRQRVSSATVGTCRKLEVLGAADLHTESHCKVSLTAVASMRCGAVRSIILRATGHRARASSITVKRAEIEEPSVKKKKKRMTAAALWLHLF